MKTISRSLYTTETVEELGSSGISTQYLAIVEQGEVVCTIQPQLAP